MKNALFPTLFLLLVIPVAFAQAPANDWGEVESLKSRTNIVVETKSGDSLKGKFTSLTATSIRFQSSGNSVTLSRNEVSRVYLTRRKSVLTRALIGAAAGAGIGFAIGGAIAVATRSDGLAAAAGFLYGIPAGAAIGALTTGRKVGRLIYNSQ